MKHFFLRWLLLPILILSFACSKEPLDGSGAPLPESDGHKVPVERALSELQSVLSAIDLQTRGASRSVADISSVHVSEVFPDTRTAGMPDAGELVYIANFEGGQGYAILGADDRLASVIAVTDFGSLTPAQFAAVAGGEYELGGETPPPVFGDAVAYAFIQMPENPIPSIGGGDGPPPPTYEDYSEWNVSAQIGPFMKMRWDQNAPFNMHAPPYGYGNCVAGCVAIAIGQIVASNRYRFERNENPMQTYGGLWVDWNVIFDKFDRTPVQINNEDFYYSLYPGDTSLAADMIARFIRGVGDEVSMRYGPQASAAYSQDAEKFLNRLGYESVDLRSYAEKHVDKMVRGREMPIYVSGNCGDSGHAWIVDGILYQNRRVMTKHQYTHETLTSYTESRELYHCNFGWGGVCDGYYAPEVFAEANRGADEAEGGDITLPPKDLLNVKCYTTDKKCITYTTAW